MRKMGLNHSKNVADVCLLYTITAKHEKNEIFLNQGFMPEDFLGYWSEIKILYKN